MQLTGQGFVVAHDEGWDVEVLNDVRHGKGLAAARHAEQYATFLPIFQLRNQFFNCIWLITARLELCMQPKPFDIRVKRFESSSFERL